jgi:pimeloyl-ACP methyl ester carboxylesterase
MSSPSSHTVTLDGLPFHYLAWGPEDAPPIVLLHGFTGHAASWRRLAEALPEQRVIALDQRGHGDSGWAPVYGTRGSAGDLPAFADALGLGSFDLLGLSMGGMNAIVFAGSHPERIDRLVILDIGPEVGTAGRARIQSSIVVDDVFADEEAAVAATRAGYPGAREDVFRERLLANLRPAEGGGVTYKYDRGFRDGTATRDDHTSDELWAFWDRIEAPTLLVRGDRSDILEAEVAERMVRRRPNATLVTLADCGHSIPLDQPEALAEAVRAFLFAGAPA